MFKQMYEEKYLRFPDGKSKAVTFSYDDGVKADKRLMQIFDEYGLKGTFNLNSLLFDCAEWHGRMNEKETYETFCNSGHEIALHGARHIFLDKVPLTEAINEIVQNRVYLEKKFGRIVRGMAYAYGAPNDEIVSLLGKLDITYARTTESSHSFALPDNWLKLKPTCHHGDKLLPELCDKFLNSSPEDEFKHREPWLFYIWGHSYEFDDNNNWNVIEDLAKKLSGRKDIWFATNQEIYDYVQAYNSLIFSMDGETVKNPAYMGVNLEIRGKIYEIGAGKTVRFDKEI